MDGENELLPGERLLWSGRPAQATITQAGLIMAAYPVVILVVATAFEFRLLKHMGTFRIVAIFVWASCVLSAAWSSIVVLLIQPANLRRSAYQVTNWRILVTSGWRRPQTRGVYLDQIDEPVLSRDRDLLLRTATASEGSGVQMVIARSRTRSPFGLGPTAPPAMLTAVDDARHVRDLIATARQAMLDDTMTAWPAVVTNADLPAGVQLAAGEQVLWTGRPARSVWWLSASDINFSVYGCYFVVFCCLAIAITVGARQAGGLILLPGVIFGIYAFIGRVLQRRRRIRASAYVLTSTRLISTWRTTVVQARLSKLCPPQVLGATVLISPVQPVPRGYGGGWKQLLWPAATVDPPQLIGISDAKAVADLIGAAQLAIRAARRGSPS